MRHSPKPFHILIRGDLSWLSLNASASATVGIFSLFHHPMYVQQYAEQADKAGINYTVYYSMYPGMMPEKPLQHVNESFQFGSVLYRSSTKWRTLPEPAQLTL